MKIGLTAIRGKIQKNIALDLVKDNLFDLSSGLVRDGYDEVGMDIGTFLGIHKTNTFITDNIEELFEKSDIVIDFSVPELTIKVAEMASKTGKTLISGTRFLNDEELDKLKKYAENCRIIYSNNMSITFNLLLNFYSLYAFNVSCKDILFTFLLAFIVPIKYIIIIEATPTKICHNSNLNGSTISKPLPI